MWMQLVSVYEVTSNIFFVQCTLIKLIGLLLTTMASQNLGSRHCVTKCAVENKLVNQNCWSWYHFSQEKLPHTCTLIPLPVMPFHFFMGHLVYKLLKVRLKLSSLIILYFFMIVGSILESHNGFRDQVCSLAAADQRSGQELGGGHRISPRGLRCRGEYWVAMTERLKESPWQKYAVCAWQDKPGVWLFDSIITETAHWEAPRKAAYSEHSILMVG